MKLCCGGFISDERSGCDRRCPAPIASTRYPVRTPISFESGLCVWERPFISRRPLHSLGPCGGPDPHELHGLVVSTRASPRWYEDQDFPGVG